MKAIAIVLGLCVMGIIVPAPAEAHIVICDATDVICIAQCMLPHDNSTAPPHLCAIRPIRP